MFNSKLSGEIDKDHIKAECEKLRLSLFASAIFEIGERYLGLPRDGMFAEIETDEEPLLYDMLTGGLYGVCDVNRAHSSTMTLNAVAASKTGRKGGGALKSVFPPLKDMAGKYAFLKKYPLFLPAAWLMRISGYLKERGSRRVHPSETLRIGRERIALLKQYGIIE